MRNGAAVLVVLMAIVWGYGMNAAADDPLATLDTAAMLSRSVVSAGNLARLQRVMAKARRGEPITVGVIGGSITQGARAGRPENRYGNRVAKWWETAFPQAKIRFINAGVGGTPSRWGVFRAQRDLLVHKPDFVVVEFGVNDSGLQEKCLPYFEGLTRQILRLPNRPAVLMLFMMNRRDGKPGCNVQEHQGRVGAHYDVPMISFRDAVYPEMEAGRLKWEDLLADRVHPNVAGHAFAARTVTAFLDGVRAALPEDADLPAVPSMPEALVTATYENVDLLLFGKLEPQRNTGWSQGGFHRYRSWDGSKPGDTITFTVEGRDIYLMLARGSNYGDLTATVDDGEPVHITNSKENRFPAIPSQVRIGENLALRPHTVVLTVGERTPDIKTTASCVFGFGVTVGPPGTAERRATAPGL